MFPLIDTTHVYIPLELIAVVSVCIVNGWHPCVVSTTKWATGSAIVITCTESIACTHPWSLSVVSITITVSPSWVMVYVGGCVSIAVDIFSIPLGKSRLVMILPLASV